MSNGNNESPENPASKGFEQMRLSCGQILQMHLEDQKTNYNVQFIGALKGLGFITSLPMSGSKGLWMPPGGRYVFRVLSGANAYAFTTQVIRARATPYPHVHFQYPNAVRSRQVRKSLRVSLQLAIELSAGDAPATPATLLDLSMHGALLETAAPLAGDAWRLSLPISLAEVESRIQIPATVRNRNDPAADATDQTARYGVEFGELPQQEAMLLHYLIDHTIAEPR